jgi:nitroreductase/NAD-dependent dihydropyrimidine dehydrogenase PreA subunit
MQSPEGEGMSRLIVNGDKCNSCGLCALECPAVIIEVPDPEALPFWTNGGEERCINCGHCVSVCPLAAISLDTMSPQECAPVEKKLLPSSEQVELLLKSRRSIRVYRQKPVSREILTKLIDIARYAASGHNSQPLQWLVIEDSKEVKRFAGMVADWMRIAIKEMPQLADSLHLDLIVADWEQGNDRIMRSAPHAIVVHAPANNVMAPGAAPVALTYLELTAYSLGLGACWAGFFQLCAAFYAPMMEALQLPEGHKSLGAMMVGYPKHRFSRIPLRNEPVITWR